MIKWFGVIPSYVAPAASLSVMGRSRTIAFACKPLKRSEPVHSFNSTQRRVTCIRYGGNRRKYSWREKVISSKPYFKKFPSSPGNYMYHLL
jgi:hypothetical protein